MSSQTQKILVYQVGAVPETLMMMPAFRRIRAISPGANLHLLSRSTSSDLAQRELFENENIFQQITFFTDPSSVVAYYWRQFLLILYFLFHSYDVIYTFAPAPDFWIRRLVAIHGCRRIYSCWWPNDPDPIPLTRLFQKRLDDLGISAGNAEDAEILQLTEQERLEAQALFRILPIPKDCVAVAVGLDDGASSSHWALDHYSALLFYPENVKKTFPLIIGNDRARAYELMRDCGGLFLKDYGDFSLRQVVGILSCCHCFVGNDSNAFYLAAASGIPTVAICLANEPVPERGKPYGDHCLKIRFDEISCAGCGFHQCPHSSVPRCIQSLSVSHVRERIVAHIDKQYNQSATA